MAIDQHRRENLLADATAYGRRVLLRVGLTEETRAPSGNPSSDTDSCDLFVGIRDRGGWSVYFDEDPVMQFNDAHEMRRLFWGGTLYAARRSHWVALRRDRIGGRVELTECEVSAEHERMLMEGCLGYLQRAWGQLSGGDFQAIGQVPEGDSALLRDVTRLLGCVRDGFLVAATPGVAGA